MSKSIDFKHVDFTPNDFGQATCHIPEIRIWAHVIIALGDQLEARIKARIPALKRSAIKVSDGKIFEYHFNVDLFSNEETCEYHSDLVGDELTLEKTLRVLEMYKPS